jgi:hypothetical protein
MDALVGGSTDSVSKRTIARAGMLAVLSTLAVSSSGGWVHALSAVWPIEVLALEGILLAWLSPETQALLDLVRRRKRSLPRCLTEDIPLEATVQALKRSTAWARLQPYLTSDKVLDHWRDGCWRFLAYGAHTDGGTASAIFAVHIPLGKGATRGALVREATRQILVQIGGS